MKRDPNERLFKYASKRVRYALIVVDLFNRRPIEIVKDEFGFLFFDDTNITNISIALLKIMISRLAEYQLFPPVQQQRQQP